MGTALSLIDYLSKHLPLKMSLDIIKDSVLHPTNDFVNDYFSDAVRCMLIWDDAHFLDHNFHIILPSHYRSQLIGIISLCRFPLRVEFVESTKEEPPKYNNDFLHRCKWTANIKVQTIPNFSFHTIEHLNAVLPSPISKSDLSNNIFQNVTKTPRLNQKYFTNEVLKVFDLPISDYKKIRVFDDSERLRIIGLIQHFQVPLNQKLLSKSSLCLPASVSN